MPDMLGLVSPIHAHERTNPGAELAVRQAHNPVRSGQKRQPARFTNHSWLLQKHFLRAKASFLARDGKYLPNRRAPLLRGVPESHPEVLVHTLNHPGPGFPTGSFISSALSDRRNSTFANSTSALRAHVGSVWQSPSSKSNHSVINCPSFLLLDLSHYSHTCPVKTTFTALFVSLGFSLDRDCVN